MIPLRGRLSLGGAPLGNLFGRISDDQAGAVVDAAWDAGIRYFDTAPFYGLGLSETRLGAALCGRDRGEYVLSTKVGLVHEDDYGYDGAMRSLERSLERLGLDRVDIVYVHDPDDRFDIAVRGAFRALDQLRSEGVITGYGAGANDLPALLATLRRTDCNVLLCARRLSLGDQSAVAELLPEAARRGVTVAAAGVFAGGAPERDLTPLHPNPSEPEHVRRVRQLCQSWSVPIEAIALQFPLRFGAVSTVLVGMRGTDEVQRNIAAISAHVPAALWAELETLGLVARAELIAPPPSTDP